MRRGSLGCVTWAAALGILGVGAMIAHAVLLPVWTSGAARALEADLSPFLHEERIAHLAHAFDPRELDMPEPRDLLLGEQPETAVNVARVRERTSSLTPGDLGVLIEARSREVSHARLDLRSLALHRQLARTGDDVRWVGVTRSRMRRGTYAYGAVTVDVERVEVAVVDLVSGELAARVTIEAAPPASTSIPLEEYRVVADRVAAAIEDVLRD